MSIPKRRGARTAVALLALAAALVACGRSGDVRQAAPPTVTVAAAEARRITDYVVFTGRTEAVETVEIRSRVSGYLQETKFRDGQMVKKGDVLFLIDPRPYQADLEAAQAQLARAQADLQLARIEYERAAELRKKNTISAADFDTKAAAYLRDQASASSAKAAADKAALNLEFTSITSPIDGRTGKASVTPGNLVTPDVKEPLAVVVSTNPVYAYADLDERQLLRYVRMNKEIRDSGGEPGKEDGKEVSTPIQMQLGDEKDFPHEGVIDFADNRVNPDTGTILIRGVFQDKDELLGPGLFVRLRFPAGLAYDAVLVPQESIGTDQGQKFVAVVGADGVAQFRKVVPGAVQPDGWQVVTGDVKAGDRVVVEGLIKVRSGEKVSATDAKTATGPAK